MKGKTRDKTPPKLPGVKEETPDFDCFIPRLHALSFLRGGAGEALPTQTHRQTVDSQACTGLKKVVVVVVVVVVVAAVEGLLQTS